MEPATTIIKAFGGVATVAALCGCAAARVYAWTWSKARGGTDGRIPQRYHAKLLTEARSRGLDVVTAEMFVLGALEPAAKTEAAADA